MTAKDEFNAMLEREGDNFTRLMTYYQCAIMEVETKLRVFDAEFQLQHDRNPIDSICSRLKSQESIAEKLARKGHPASVESIEGNLNDVAGVRVVCSLPEDAYTLGKLLASQDDVGLVRCRDYIAHPKESGYRSLHLVVELPIFLEHGKRSIKVEVQFRSIAQNFWAALDHQFQYKKDFDAAEEESIVAELRAVAEEAAALDNRMQALRYRIFGR